MSVRGWGIAPSMMPRMCMRPAFACSSADLHDLAGDAGDLDVHLERGDALAGAGDLEVHVAVVVLLAGDVGEHRERVVLLDQAHGDAGHRREERHAGVEHGERAAADRRHRRGAVRLQDVGDDADGVGELVLVRQHRQRARGGPARRGRSRAGRGRAGTSPRRRRRGGSCSAAGTSGCSPPRTPRSPGRRGWCRASR